MNQKTDQYVHPAFHTVVMAPTIFNKQLFINEHRPYISACIYRIQPFATQDVRDDYVSEVVLILLQNIENIDFSNGYKRVLGYIGQVSNHFLNVNFRRMNRDKRIPQSALTQIEDWQDLLELNMADEYITAQLDLIKEALTDTRPNERLIIEGLLDGKNYKDLGVTRQAVSICLKRFSKRLKNIK